MAPSVRNVTVPLSVACRTVTSESPTPEPSVRRRRDTAVATNAPAKAALHEKRFDAASSLTMVAVSSLSTVVVVMGIPVLAHASNAPGTALFRSVFRGRYAGTFSATRAFPRRLHWGNAHALASALADRYSDPDHHHSVARYRPRLIRKAQKQKPRRGMPRRGLLFVMRYASGAGLERREAGSDRTRIAGRHGTRHGK